LNRLKTLLRSPLSLRAQFEDSALARAPHHELAVCAIFCEEAPFFEEWLSFHRGIGATHFYLYNNFSTDEFRAALAPWLARGLVTLHDWPHPVGQVSAYRHCVRHYRRVGRWIAFLDLDEFLFSPEALDICPILREYAEFPGIVARGMFFGAAGHETRPPGSLLDAFTRRAPWQVALSGKTIANPRMIYAIRSPHAFKYWRGEAVDTLRRPLSEGQRPPVFDRLRFNHYWSRSLADLRTKVGRGDASTWHGRDLAWHLGFEAQLNEEEDRTIVSIAAKVRAAAKEQTDSLATVAESG
jgi:hypothetical protein